MVVSNRGDVTAEQARIEIALVADGVEVEKAELEVLKGIRSEHWPLVRSVIVEVHDLDGRVGDVVGMLEASRFDVTTEQDPLLKDTGIFTVTALRA